MLAGNGRYLFFLLPSSLFFLFPSSWSLCLLLSCHPIQIEGNEAKRPRMSNKSDAVVLVFFSFLFVCLFVRLLLPNIFASLTLMSPWREKQEIPWTLIRALGGASRQRYSFLFTSSFVCCFLVSFFRWSWIRPLSPYFQEYHQRSRSRSPCMDSEWAIGGPWGIRLSQSRSWAHRRARNPSAGLPALHLQGPTRGGPKDGTRSKVGSHRRGDLWKV